MNTKENAPEKRGIQGANRVASIKRKSNKLSLKTKEGKVAIALMQRSYNRFEAVRDLHDWCLHSTVSTLQSKGVFVARETETIPGYEGSPTRCCRYWIPASEHHKVNRMLGVVQ
ncbi:MAG: hypothetical protein KZQ92_00395 [Candidatus Thiodiazotropha sp. (ex Lucinoma borealis)]|nr:hypothetical protein [Candidatus Thiodiazotropha sp. (ex Lucinoma borealis)]